MAPAIPEIMKYPNYQYFSVSVLLSVTVTIVSTSIIFRYYETPITKYIKKYGF